MTDILLGIVRTIIKNPPFISRKQKAHIQLITYFLKDTRFYDFMKRLNYYEWTSSRQLTGVDFSNYLELFIVTNYELYLED